MVFAGLTRSFPGMAEGGERVTGIAPMRCALEMFLVEGIRTSVPLHQRILAGPDFLAGRFDTGFIKRFLPNAAQVTAGAPV